MNLHLTGRAIWRHKKLQHIEERVINILEEHDLDSFVATMIEEPTTNARRTNYKKNQEKEKRIIYDSVKDNLMSMITPLKMET